MDKEAIIHNIEELSILSCTSIEEVWERSPEGIKEDIPLQELKKSNKLKKYTEEAHG